MVCWVCGVTTGYTGSHEDVLMTRMLQFRQGWMVPPIEVVVSDAAPRVRDPAQRRRLPELCNISRAAAEQRFGISFLYRVCILVAMLGMGERSPSVAKPFRC